MKPINILMDSQKLSKFYNKESPILHRAFFILLKYIKNKNINIFVVLYINICYNTDMIVDVYIRQI